MRFRGGRPVPGGDQSSIVNDVIDQLTGTYPNYPNAGEGGNAIMLPNFTGDKKAQKTREWLARQEWSDYLTRYAPREVELLQRTSREGALEELNSRLGNIHADTKRAYQANQQAVDMANDRYGVSQNTQLSEAQERRSGIAQSLSEVDAVNRSRDSITNRNANIVGGGGMTGRQLING